MPFSLSLEVTHNATFVTMVTGMRSNIFFYQWKHNGTIINGETGNVLVITDVMESDSGNYECTVTNQFGYTNVSNVAVLTVTSELAICYYIQGNSKLCMIH